MATKAFTDIAIRNMRPGAARREIPDPGARGLYVVIQPSGRKGFAVRYRNGAGKPCKLTLTAGISLAAARRAAADALYEVEQGRDPSETKKTAKEKAAAAKADTLEAICKEYMTREGKKLRTEHQRKRILERLIYPKLGSRQIDAIKRTDIVRLLDGIEDKNGARMAHEALAIIRKIMNWFATRSDEFRSPIVRGMGRINAKERERKRVLTDDELRSVWQTAENDTGPFAALVRFLLLTSARRAEAVALRWDEIAGTDWILPAARNKTKLDLVRPLSKAAQAVLAKQPRVGAFVFSRTGDCALSGVSWLKADFDAASGVSDWRLHDLRRTARSLMSRGGVNSDHAERCLGQVIGGVRGVYDRYEYREEKAQAFDVVASLIERIVHPQENVVPLTRPVS